MCGIAGFTHLDGAPHPERIWQVTRSITHRGPDKQDVWESSHTSLGAVRLKIIDLEHGDQPMVSEDGGTVLVFNGEIYNHAELREELEALMRAWCHARTRAEVIAAFDEVDAAILAANAADGPALVWFEIAEEQNVYPMMPAGKGLSDLLEEERFGSGEGAR